MLLILAGFAVLADQLTKDAALAHGSGLVVHIGLFVPVLVGLALIAAVWLRRRAAGLVLVAAGLATALLDAVVHGGLVFPWRLSGVGLSVGAVLLVMGAVVSVLELSGGVSMKPRIAARTLRNAPRGMTLIEILVVIAIIGIVATVVAVGVVGYLADAKKEATRTLIHTVADGVQSYAAVKRRLPKDLGELVEAKYIKKNQTKDPWEQDLEYQQGSGNDLDDFTLCSKGPDGSGGNDDDICFGEEKE